MIIEEITELEFDAYAKTHPLRSTYQSGANAKLMEYYKFKPTYIAGKINNKIVAASLILIRQVSLSKYGYAPRGFLINYYDSQLLLDFTKALKSYFSSKGIAFIKINPEITYSIIEPTSGEKAINRRSHELINVLETLEYKKLKANLYFESELPRFNAIIKLNDYDRNKLDKTILNKIEESENRGMTLVKGSLDYITEFSKLTKKNVSKYYENYYAVFSEKNMMDMFLAELDYHKYLAFVQKEHIKEQENNEKINRDFIMNPDSDGLYEIKLASDKRLSDLNIEMGEVASILNKDPEAKLYLGTALVSLCDNRVNIIYSTFKKDYPNVFPDYYLYNAIIEHYQDLGYKFLDLNGITGDFSDANPYKTLNDFKLSFNPEVYEYIGEFDLVINESMYAMLWKTGVLKREFDDKHLLNQTSKKE